MIARRDPEATRRAILDAAEQVFLDGGYAEASTSQIARLAGVTKSLIHHHFGSKEALWKEVKLARFAQYGERQRQMLMTSGGDAELLRQSMDFYFHFLKDNPEMIRLLAWMFLEDDDDCSDLDRELTAMGVEKLREAQANGELRDDIDPHFVLFTFLALAQHWFQFRDHFLRDAGLDAEDSDLDEAYLQAALKIYFEGVGPR